MKCLALIILLAAVPLELSDAAKVTNEPKLVELVEELNNPEDSNATITCSVGSGELQSLSYEWFKDEQRLLPQPNKLRIDIPPDNYQSTLRIFELKPADGGLYTCVARNRFGQSKISTRLNVNVQLKWTSEPSDVRASAGRALQVDCSAEANPSPKVEWFKGELGGGGSSLSRDNYLGSSLQFNSLSPSDSGYYTCRASNGLEEDLVKQIKVDVLVNITVSNSPKIIDAVEKLNHVEGTNATFTCPIGSGDLGSLSYTWFKDEQPIEASQQRNKIRLITLPENIQSILRVINLTREDSGLYTCQAKNKFGSDKVSTRLNVKVQLKWIEKPEGSLEFKAGRPMEVACRADGSPKPTIEWRKEGSSELIGSELRSQSVKEEEGGIYICRAANGVDKDLLASVEVKVLGK